MFLYLDNNPVFVRSSNLESSVFLINKVSVNFGGLFHFVFGTALFGKLAEVYIKYIKVKIKYESSQYFFLSYVEFVLLLESFGGHIINVNLFNFISISRI